MPEAVSPLDFEQEQEGGHALANWGRYETGDRVWVRGGLGRRLPGVVIGLHEDWGLYRVAYMVDVAGRGPRAIEEWRLSPRQRDEPPALD